MSEEIQVEVPPAKRQRLNDSNGSCTNAKGVDRDITHNNTEDKCGSEDSYGNFVTPEELERLKEFKVLDEVKSNEEDSNDEESDSSDGLPEDEIEKMLEEDLPEDFKGAPKPKEKPYVTRQKIVLEEKGVNHFEVLPLDWIMVRHISGMPIYMHRASRVCTLSKPYFLGKGNTRRHDIPISAIPCYAYRRALEEEEKQQEIDRRIAEQIRSGNWVVNSQTQAKAEFNGNNQTDGDKTSDVTENSNYIEIQMKEEIPQETGIECPFRNVNKMEDGEQQRVDSTEEIKECHVDRADDQPEQITKINSTEIADESSGEQSETRAGEQPENRAEEQPETRAEEQPETRAEEQSEKRAEEQPETRDEDQLEEQAATSGIEGSSDIPLNRQPVVLPGGIVMPPPRVETVNTSWKSQHLTAEQINDYCKKLFKFKTINIMHFKRWAYRRKYTKARKTLQYPTLPEGTKLITIPAQPAAPGEENSASGKSNKRDWVMNMNGRSYLSVFHEYVRRALQKQPVYEFRQLENASTPYQATVYIGGMQYGVGHGSSKRQAKSAAARNSIHILIPEMKDELDAHAPQTPTNNASNEPDFSFFDYVGIEDPRITEFCATTCEPSPHAILRTCLLRNFGAGDPQIHTEMKKLEYQKIELTMKVGKHTATVVSKNKKTAKQRASQAILQALHPHVRSWGSLLRLYGSRSVKSCKEKKQEEQQITLLQDKARHNEPNYAVLEKLRNEMQKLRARDEAVVPIGTLLLQDDLPTHSGSNLNNVDL